MADEVTEEITDEPAEANALAEQYPAGVSEGEVVPSITEKGNVAQETIRHDTDEEGNVLGWSKQPDPENPHPEHDPDGPLAIPDPNAEDEEVPEEQE